MIIKNEQTNQKLIRQILLLAFVFSFAMIYSFSKKHDDNTDSVYQFGKASYYGKPFIGRKTANGEIFTENLYTCAHKTLPFGTKLKVTNLINNQSIIVRVNDRGPYVHSRIVDLSIRGAKDLGLMSSGVANVSIEIVHKEFSTLGNVKTMEKINVDEKNAYIDINDEAALNKIFNYLQTSNQAENIPPVQIVYNTKSEIEIVE